MFDGFATRLFAAAALCAATSPSALAQSAPQQIEIPAGSGFTHEHSKLALPPAIDGIALTRVRTLVDDQLDVIVNYDTADSSEAISVYIYRDVAGALPVWFDRARWAVESRTDLYGTARAVDGKLTFAPPGRTVESGLIAVYAPSKAPYLSTGVALVPLGEWMIKIRYSSATHAAETLDERIRGVLAQLKWPSALAEEPAALTVIECAEPLAAAKASKLAPSDGAAALLGAMLAIPDAGTPGRAAKAPQWCRDDSVEPKGNVYRANGATDAYLIALSDAGRGISVRPDEAASLLGKRTKRVWTIQFLDLARTVNFPSQDRLTPPRQALEIFQAGRYVSTVSTWGQERTVNLNSDGLKE